MNDIFKAKMLIDKADSIIILSGAGMGADSGLPVSEVMMVYGNITLF